MMNSQQDKAQLLMDNGRYEQALVLLSQLRASTPEDAIPSAMLADCFANMNRLEDALNEIKVALSLDPENPVIHYYHAHFLMQNNQDEASLSAIDQAISIDPQDSAYPSHKSQIYIQLKKWDLARKTALHALELNPESEIAQNSLAHALQQLGEDAGASEAMVAALKNNPESDYTLATQGLILMHQKKYNQAMAFFKEALRINPESGQARHGVITILKARNPFYRGLLQFNLWLSKFEGKVVMGAIFVAWLLVKALRNLAENNPELKPWIAPILVIYTCAIVYLWFCDPIANFLLRLSPNGRYFLSKLERRGAEWVGFWLVCGLAAVFGAIFLHQSILYGLAIGFACLILPFHEAHDDDEPYRRWYLIFSWVMAGLLITWFYLNSLGSFFHWLPAGMFLIGFIAFQWLTVIHQARR